MRRFFTFFCTFIYCCTHSCLTFAQPGWQWGVGNLPGLNPGFAETAAAKDHSGNVYAAGFTEAVSGFPMNYLVFGIDTIIVEPLLEKQIIVKTDSNGNFLWVKGSSHADAWPIAMVTDDRDNLYVLGKFEDSNYIAFDGVIVPGSAASAYYLLKYNALGNVVWAKPLVNNDGFSLPAGGLGIDDAGYIYVSASFDQLTATFGSTTLTNINPGINRGDIFVAKFDPAGNAIWARSFGGSSDDFTMTMTVAHSGDIFLEGLFRSDTVVVGGRVITDTVGPGTITHPHCFITRLDSSGNVRWAWQINRNIVANALTTDALENLYMAGYIDSGTVWGTDTLTCTGTFNAVVAACDSSGNLLWAKSGGNNGSEQGYSVAVDNCNRIWVAGGFSGDSISFGSPDAIRKPYIYADPAFIAAFSPAGIYDTGFAVGSGGHEFTTILTSGPDKVYLVGSYRDIPLVFGHDTLLAPPVTGYTEEMYIAEYTAPCTSGSSGDSTLHSAVSQTALQDILIYPNPAFDEVTISCPAGFPTASVARIYDVSGRLVTVVPLFGQMVTIPVAHYAAGVYQCQLISGSSLINRKIVISR